MKAAPTPLLEVPLAGGSLLALVVYAVAMAFTPGQNTLHLLSPGGRSGLIRGGGHLLGTLWGTYLMICLAGVLLGALFLAAPGVQGVLRVAAGFCMLWLAIRLWRNATPPVVHTLRPRRFGEAVLVQLGNAKAWLLAVAVIAGFVPAGGQYLERMLTAALVFCLASLPGLVLWAARGDTMQRAMHHGPRRGLAMVTAATALLFWT